MRSLSGLPETFKGFSAHNNDGIGCFGGNLSKMGEVFGDVPGNGIIGGSADSTIFITGNDEFATGVHYMIYIRM